MNGTGLGDRPLRVAVDGRVLDDRYHGIGRVTEAILHEFARRPDVAVTLILRPVQEGRRFQPHALARDLGIEVALFDRDVASKTQFLAWPGFLRRMQPDVAFFPYSLAAPIAGRTRSFTVVHDCILESDRRWAPSSRVQLLYRAMTLLAVRHNRVITPSKASAKAVERFYRVRVPDDRVVHWGVDPAFGAEHDDDVTTVQGRPLPARFHLHVGARRPHKNVGLLVEALAHRPSDEHLVLVGSVDPRFDDPVPALVARFELTDRVHHFRHVTDAELTSLYRRADAFVYPSLIEGVGLPLLEAMVAGAPIVASDIPVFREIADDAAAFASPTSVEDWAAALGRLRDDRHVRDQLVARGRTVARAATWAETGRMLTDMFRREVTNPNL